jgi:hypothetical protein
MGSVCKEMLCQKYREKAGRKWANLLKHQSNQKKTNCIKYFSIVLGLWQMLSGGQSLDFSLYTFKLNIRR